MSTDFLTNGLWNIPRHRRFEITIPLTDSRWPGNGGGYIVIQVMALSERQARAVARKEMIKMARQCTNSAKVIDVDPPSEQEDDRRYF